MKKGILGLLVVFSLSGCLEEFEDGYQFGDITRSVITYCDDYSDDVMREDALEKIHDKFPSVSEEGICEGLNE